MTARKLKLVFCEDWFIYMYDPETNQCYMYNTETMPEWADLPKGADLEKDAVEKYMLPIVRRQNRSLIPIDCIYDPATEQMIYTGKD